MIFFLNKYGLVSGRVSRTTAAEGNLRYLGWSHHWVIRAVLPVD